MADAEQFKNKVQSVLKAMTLGQKMTIGTTLLVAVLGFTLLFRWATKPDYQLLFANLDQKEAGQIAESLRGQNVPYQLSAGGTSVLIPSNLVYEWRNRLAQEGLPTSGNIGYELFDQNEIGLSDFVQKVNYRRAIEGELSRTISTIQDIQQARVHIVIPEDRLFKQDQHETTASIVLKLGNGKRLREAQIQGIANLVAAAVEGLRPGSVKIVDTQGRMLSSAYDDDSMMGVTSSQLDLQRRVELHLTDKAQSVLSAVLGEGRAHVRVTAELNFQRIERTQENYDPNNTAVLSEERSEQSNQDQQNATGTQEYFTTNYNVPKTVEHIIEPVGNIEKISVSVVVDDVHMQVTDAQGVVSDSVRSRTANEMTALQNIIQNAVGFDQVRGDQIQIENIPFDLPEQLPMMQAGQLFGIDVQYLDLAQKAVPVLFLIVFLFIIRGRLKSMRVSMPSQSMQLRPAGGGARLSSVIDDGPLPRIDEGASPEVLESVKLLKQISEFVEEKPSAAVKLIRYWLLEE